MANLFKNRKPSFVAKEEIDFGSISRDEQLNRIAWYPVSFMHVDNKSGEVINIYNIDGVRAEFPASEVLEKRKKLLHKHSCDEEREF